MVHPQALGTESLQHPLQAGFDPSPAILRDRSGTLQSRSQLIGHPSLMGCAHGKKQRTTMLPGACRSSIRLDFSGLVP
jgi:hypothetical protein